MTALMPLFHDSADVLTEVLHATRLEARMIYRIELIAPWGMSLSSPKGASFHFVERGSCWLRSPHMPDAMLLNAGELVVLPRSPFHELVDALETPTIPVHQLIAKRDSRGRVYPTVVSDGETTALVCGSFYFERGGTHPLFSMLPPLMRIQAEQSHTVEWLMILLKSIGDEINNTRPGRETIISRLTDVLFIMIIRYWIEHHPDDGAGWLSALYDPRIAAALGCVHRQPEQEWTVERLAAHVNMSRSAFAARFTELVGESPLKYLTRWRMQVAMNWLTDEGASTEEIARRAGYSSVYAFSKTFKRWVGTTPGEYRRLPRVEHDHGEDW